MLIAPGRGPPLRVSVMEPASSSSSLRFSRAAPIPCPSSRTSLGDISPSSIMASARERNLSSSSRLCSLAYTRRAWFACMGVLWRGALKPSFAAIDDTVDWALPTIRAIAPWESPPSLSNETILALSSGVSGDLCVIGKAPISRLAMNQRGTHDYLVVAWLQNPGEEGHPRKRRIPPKPTIEQDVRFSAGTPSPLVPPALYIARERGPRDPLPRNFLLRQVGKALCLMSSRVSPLCLPVTGIRWPPRNPAPREIAIAALSLLSKVITAVV